MEQDRLKNKEIFKEIFDKSTIGILIYDKKGKLVDANASALEIFGISRLKDILGSEIFDDQNIKSNRQKLIKEGVINFQSALDNKGFKFSKLSKNGLFDWNVSVTDLGFLVQIQEIKQYNKDEKSTHENKERYNSFFEDDLTGDFIATPDGEVILCNSSFVEIYGFDSLKKALESKISEFNPSDWINLINQLNNDFKINGHQSWHRRPDGVIIHVVANLVGIYNDSNELTQVKGYVFDDTERKNAEEFLRESEKKYHNLFDEI